MKNYNDKEFLLPESPDSCASYHAKTEGDNDSYKLIISDCNKSIIRCSALCAIILM